MARARRVKGVVALLDVVADRARGLPLERGDPHGRGRGATSAGCSTTSPGSTTLSLKVNGFTRTVIVHVPKDSTGTTPLALVFNLHGSGSTALDQEGFTKMDKTSNQDGFIVAYPQALLPDGTGFDWNIPGVPLIGGRPRAGEVGERREVPDLPRRHHGVEVLRQSQRGLLDRFLGRGTNDQPTRLRGLRASSPRSRRSVDCADPRPVRRHARCR